MLGTAPGTQAVIDLEDRAPDILFASVDDGIPLWPQFRTGVWSALNTAEYGLSRSSPSRTPSRLGAWAHIVRSFLPSRWDAPLRARRAGVCFVVHGGTVAASGGREVNWLVGPLAQASGDDAAIVQSRPLPGRWGRPMYMATWSMEPASVRAETLARASRRDPSDRVASIVRETLSQIETRMTEETVKSITAGAIANERMRPFELAAWRRVLDRVQPSVVIMEDASYGTRAPLIAMMKERGIVVAEPQHGWIGPSHAAYNYGAAMYDDLLRVALPDHLLTFGDEWSKGLRFPGEVTAVGKPHLDAAASEFSLPYEQRTEVLVVSSTTDPEQMSDVVLSLRALLPTDLIVVFRPHPSERPVVAQRYPRLVDIDGVRIDDRGDVYETLGVARAVVGMASTVLFEATAFGCQVFALESPMAEYYVGDRFGPPLDIGGLESVAVAVSRPTGSADVATRDNGLWAPDPAANFRSWLAKVQTRVD
jgi:hypothetical protein